ncbi:hypothetical protein [Streptococcus phocae]|uniref:Uncharacterized protein n=1 Tax=Streptococcus phocae TaxID=119224 RepID=A0A0P6SIM3_9STRE|nr:hypothetical protein [Streptococcus phocae]KPJ22100.1 hypothetical protein AKK44_06270 [Streptococcus phocae]
MKQTLKILGFASLIALCLGATATLPQPSLVRADIVVPANQSESPEATNIKKIKAQIRENIKEKLKDPSKDGQKIKQRLPQFGETDDQAVERFMEHLDLIFLINTEGLYTFDWVTTQQLLNGGLENNLSGDYGRPLNELMAELTDYYECFNYYFSIENETMLVNLFEDYIFSSNDTKPLPKDQLIGKGGKTRFSKLRDYLKFPS